MAQVTHRRTFLQHTLAMGLASPWLGLPLRAPAADDAILAHVLPELRSVVTQTVLPMAQKMAPYSRATLSQNRERMRAWLRPRLADVPVEKRTVAGANGQPDVTVYVVNARSDGQRPAILHTHGGGFVAGSAEFDVPTLQALGKLLDCAIVTVDYRLAPEMTYAGSIEDNYAGLKWLYQNAAALGVDRTRIAVMGESAGGGHAALLAITARDRGEVPVAFQCLIYPMLDDRTGSTRDVPAHVGTLIWNAASNRFGWESFLGMRPGGRNVPRRAVPARVDKLTGLPPAFIGVGSIDLFVDEDVDYAQRLNAAGVVTELLVVPGAFHGFDMIAADTRIARAFNAARYAALRRGLGLAAG